MSRRRPLSLLTIPAVALVVAGCGSGGASNASTTTTKTTSAAPTATTSTSKGKILRLSADPSGQLRFTTSRLTVSKPGKVTLIMANPGSAGMQHGIAIEGKGVDRDGKIVGPGHTSMVTVTLKKGVYSFYCPVPGHEAAGMKGKLTVK